MTPSANARPDRGGLLLRWNVAGLGWRPIFPINVPVGLAALVAGWLVIRESRSPAAPRLDLVGMALAITGVLMLVYPVTEGRTLGWPAWTFVLMAGSAVVLVIFVGYEQWRARTAGSPLMPLGLFRARTFSAGMVIWLIFWIALGGFFLAWMLYLQIGLGWTPLHAGLTALTFAVGAAAGAGLSVQVLTPRFGRWGLMAGALLNAAGFARAGVQANAHNFARTFAIVLGYAAGLLVLVCLGMVALSRRMRHRDLDAELLAAQRAEVRA